MKYYTLTPAEGKLLQSFDDNELVSIKKKDVKKRYTDYARTSILHQYSNVNNG